MGMLVFCGEERRALHSPAAPPSQSREAAGTFVARRKPGRHEAHNRKAGHLQPNDPRRDAGSAASQFSS